MKSISQFVLAISPASLAPLGVEFASFQGFKSYGEALSIIYNLWIIPIKLSTLMTQWIQFKILLIIWLAVILCPLYESAQGGGGVKKCPQLRTWVQYTLDITQKGREISSSDHGASILFYLICIGKRSYCLKISHNTSKLIHDNFNWISGREYG